MFRIRVNYLNIWRDVNMKTGETVKTPEVRGEAKK